MHILSGINQNEGANCE
jgi:hypothetical protein